MDPKAEEAFRDFVETLWDVMLTKYDKMEPCWECVEWPDCDDKEKFCVDATLGILKDEPWAPRYR